MNATRLPAEHRRVLAQYLNVPEAELDKALARPAPIIRKDTAR